MNTKILWACKVDQPDYMEEIITECEDRIPLAMQWAKENGFDRLRIANIDLSIKPDFIQSIRITNSK